MRWLQMAFWFILPVLPMTSQSVVAHQWLGGVVPHHMLVESEIERFWQEAQQRTVADVVVLIGPDHDNQGDNIISTHDDAVTYADHSITAHLPFIAKYFSGAEIIPLIIRSDGTKEQMLQLAQNLRSTYQEHTVLVVASVDFSHYQSYDQAQHYDAESITAIQKFDYDALQFYNSEHLDSDQAIIAMSEAVCPTRDCSWETLYHGNSEDYIPSYDMTTSYFSLFLHE